MGIILVFTLTDLNLLHVGYGSTEKSLPSPFGLASRGRPGAGLLGPVLRSSRATPEPAAFRWAGSVAGA
jgi:hypothetical protein